MQRISTLGVALGVVAGLAVAGCGGSDARPEARAEAAPVSERARPEDPSVHEALDAPGAAATLDIPADELDKVLEERATDPAYEASVHQAPNGSAHHDATAGDPLAAPTAEELARAARAALRYPTVADAREAGYLPVGSDVPALGVHFAQFK